MGPKAHSCPLLLSSGMPDNQSPQVTREEINEFRRVVADALSELRSQEVRNAFSSLTLEELVDQHIEMLESTDDQKLGRLARLRKVKEDLLARIEAIKEVPPEAFRRSSSTDAETPSEPGSDASEL